MVNICGEEEESAAFLAPSVPPPVWVVETSQPPAEPLSGNDERTVASALAQSPAKEKRSDLFDIATVGTGPDRRILVDDVHRYLPLAASTPSRRRRCRTTDGIDHALPVRHDGVAVYSLFSTSVDRVDLLAHSEQTVPHYGTC